MGWFTSGSTTKAERNPELVEQMDGDEVVIDPRHPNIVGKNRLVIGDVVALEGTGFVRKACDSYLLRIMGIRELPGRDLESKEAHTALIEEAQITSQLNHPGIMPVYALGVDEDDAPYFTTRLIRSWTLARVFDEATNPTSRSLFKQLQWLLDVCGTLAYAHSRNVLHRNVRPESILVGDYGDVYLADWSIARLRNQDRPTGRHGHLPSVLEREQGFCCYMPPEIAAGNEPWDVRSDVFSLGAVLYEMLTHVPPYLEKTPEAALQKARDCAIVPPHERADAPAGLCAIATKAMSRDPAGRYPSVGDFKAELEGFLESGLQFPTRHYAPGELIVKEGEQGDTAYIITSGSCRAFATIDGQRKEWGIMKEGDVFGEMAVFTTQTRTASVEAVDDVTVALIRASEFDGELGLNPVLGKFMKALVTRFLKKEARVIELEKKGAGS